MLMKNEIILNYPLQAKTNLLMNKKFFTGLAILLTLISGIVIGKYFFPGNKNVSPVSGVAPVKNEIQ